MGQRWADARAGSAAAPIAGLGRRSAEGLLGTERAAEIDLETFAGRLGEESLGRLVGDAVGEALGLCLPRWRIEVQLRSSGAG